MKVVNNTQKDFFGSRLLVICFILYFVTRKGRIQAVLMATGRTGTALQAVIFEASKRPYEAFPAGKRP